MKTPETCRPVNLDKLVLFKFNETLAQKKEGEEKLKRIPNIDLSHECTHIHIHIKKPNCGSTE